MPTPRYLITQSEIWGSIIEFAGLELLVNLFGRKHVTSYLRQVVVALVLIEN